MAFSNLSRCLFCGETIATGNYCNFRCRKQGLKQAMFEAKADREIEAAGKESQQWISVDERLPEERQTVLLSLAEPYHKHKTWLGYWWSTGNGNQIAYQIQGLSAVPSRYVTHWQPLPAPPPVEEVAEQEPKLGFCKDCHYWRAAILPSGANGDIGKCVNLEVKIMKKATDAYGGIQWIDPITEANFGCIQFEPREEE